MRKLLILIFTIALFDIVHAEEISFQIKTQIILAGKITQSTDPRLTELAEKLNNYLNYTSYRLISSEETDLEIRKKHKISLPEKGFLQLKILREVDSGISLKIYNRGGKDFNSIVHLKPGGAVHFVSSKVKEGDIIVSLTMNNNIKE